MEIKNFQDALALNWDWLLEKGVHLDEIYGCGSYGCAFGTNNQYWVAKVTNDPLEMNFYEFAQMTGHPIFVRIREITPLPEWPAHPRFYLVIREAVDVDSHPFPHQVEELSEALDYFATEYPFVDIDDVRSANVGISLINDRLVIFDAQVEVEEE